MVVGGDEVLKNLKKSENTGIDFFFYVVCACHYRIYLNGFILNNTPCGDCNRKNTNTVYDYI